MAYDPKRGDHLFSKTIPDFAPNSTIAVVDHTCPHCKEFLALTNYPTQTDKGSPVIYLDYASPTVQKYYQEHLASLVPRGKENFPIVISVDANRNPSQFIASGPDEVTAKLFIHNALFPDVSEAAKPLADGCKVDPHGANHHLPTKPATNCSIRK